jgi:hypothetical protein
MRVVASLYIEPIGVGGIYYMRPESELLNQVTKSLAKVSYDLTKHTRLLTSGPGTCQLRVMTNFRPPVNSSAVSQGLIFFFFFLNLRLYCITDNEGQNSRYYTMEN